MGKELLLIIPVYNEEESIGKLIDKIRGENIEDIADILIINDGSRDNTEGIVKSKLVKIINKPFNLGYGSSLQLGYKYATNKEYKYIIQIDGDGQHDVSNIKEIYLALRGKTSGFKIKPDIVIGSRFLSEKKEMKISFMKNMAISLFRKIIKFFTNKEITDPTSGLQGLNRTAFSFYSKCGNFDYQYPDINMIIQMLMMGYKIVEIPARMHERKTGESMHAGLIKPIKYMFLISLSTISIIIRQRKDYYRLIKKEIDGEAQNE